MPRELTKHTRRSKYSPLRVIQFIRAKSKKGKVKRDPKPLQSNAFLASPASIEQLENDANFRRERRKQLEKTSSQNQGCQLPTMEESVWDGGNNSCQEWAEVHADVARLVKGDQHDVDTRSLQPENKDKIQQVKKPYKNRNIHEVDRACVTPNNADTESTALKVPETTMLAKLRRRDLTGHTKATCNTQKLFTPNESSPSNSSNGDYMQALLKKASTIYHRRSTKKSCDVVYVPALEHSVFNDGGITQYPRNIPSPIPDSRQQQYTKSDLLVNCCTDRLLVPAATMAISLFPHLAVGMVTKQEANIVPPVYTTMCTTSQGRGRKLPIKADDCEKFIAALQSKVTNVPADELLMSKLQEMMAGMQETFNQKSYHTAQTLINGQKAAVETASVTKESSLTLTRQQVKNYVPAVTTTDRYRLKEMTSQLRCAWTLMKKMVTDGTAGMKMGKVQLSASERAATLDELEAICYDVCKPKKYQIPDAILATAYVTTDCSPADSIIPYLSTEICIGYC